MELKICRKNGRVFLLVGFVAVLLLFSNSLHANAKELEGDQNTVGQNESALEMPDRAEGSVIVSTGGTEASSTESSGGTEASSTESSGGTEASSAESSGGMEVSSETADDAETYTDKQGIQYELYDGHTCYVSGYTEKVKSTINIPEQIEDAGSVYQVVGIQESAFRKCSILKKIEIPDSVADLHSGAFLGCRNLTDISMIPVDTSAKKSGQAMIVPIKINSVLLAAAPSVKLVIREDVIKKADGNKKTDTITLMISPSDSSEKVAVPNGIVLQEAAVKAAAESGKNLKVRIKDTQGISRYIKVDSDDLEQAEGELCLLFEEKRAGNTSGAFHDDVFKAMEKNKIRSGGVKTFRFSFGSGYKTNVDLTVPVQDVGSSKAGDSLYVYRYDKNNHIFAAQFCQPYTVSADGSIKITISKGGEFVLSKKPFQYMSRKPANQFLTQAGSTYYVDKSGDFLRGWRKIGGDYYYFDRENGKMASSAEVDGIKISGNGTAEPTQADEQKIQTMMKARAVVEQITNESDSKSQKIEKCFRWIFQFPYRRYRRLKPIYKQPGWEVTFANDIFDKHQGCCVSEAAATAFLFHECGYETVYVACDTGHAWVELNGRVYDPLFAEARGFDRYYNVPYDGYGMWAVLKRKI